MGSLAGVLLGAALVLARERIDRSIQQPGDAPLYLNLPELGKYWHVDRPGRDPLRIVKTPLVPEQSFMMFGSPVVWINEADAKSGTAFMRITGLTATKTRATLTFEYPIEGVTGTATYAHSFGTEWRVEHGDVRETK